MKSNYWQPVKSSSMGLLAITLVSLAGLTAVELIRTQPRQAYVSEKLAAATVAHKAMKVVKEEHVQRSLPIDPATDPTQSGLIGRLASPVTSNNGYLPAKQTTVNPNFAAVVVQMLKEAGLQEGDTVAVGMSGSFPAMNICVFSAIETLKLRPIVISSASASQWGANNPELLWIDMERALNERGILASRSVAGSVGGIEDRGVGLSNKGREMVVHAIERNHLALIDPADYLDSVNQRMAIYRQHANGAPIRAYVNVGGGTTSVGTKEGKARFEPGLNLHQPPGQLPVDSVMARFSGQDIPVIHLVHIKTLATQYGLPIQPTEMPRVGEGQVYSPRTYNPWLASIVLGGILVGLLYIARTRPLIPRSALTRSQRAKSPAAQLEEELAAC